MKKFVFILALIISLLFLLTACGKSKNKSEEDSQAVTADSLLDNKIFADATRWKNLPQCEQILDALKKEECVKTIESNELLDEAVKKGDKKLCAKIELDRYKTFCQESIEQKIKETRAKEEKLEKIKKEQSLAQKFAFEDNLEGCNEIEDENFQKQCKANILTERAVKFNDAKYCDQLGEVLPEEKESCLDLIKSDATE
jgi:hypothetical protein